MESILQMWLLAFSCLAAVAAAQGDPAVNEAAAADCVRAPSDAACTTFRYPDANATTDLLRLCKAMPYMAACSIAAACNASDGSVASSNAAVCEPLTLVQTICKHDTGMGGMRGCESASLMCASGSKVSQCQEQAGLAHVPTTNTLNAQVQSICTEMTMDGCELCTPSWAEGKTYADCDLLAVYSSLCWQMPEMSQCGEWHAMCKADAELYLCSGAATAVASGAPPGGGEPAPVMKMYFFTDMPFYLLFKSWTPSTQGELVGAFFAVFFMGVAYEVLQALRYQLEVRWLQPPPRQPGWQLPTSYSSNRNATNGAGFVGNGAAFATANGGVVAATNGVGAPPKGGEAGDVESGQGVRSAGGSAGAASGGDLVSPAGSCCATLEQPQPGARAWRGGSRRPHWLVVDLTRALMQFVIVGLSYLLMLAAMSFNVTIFFGVVSGYAFGTLLCGRLRGREAEGAPRDVCHGG